MSAQVPLLSPQSPVHQGPQQEPDRRPGFGAAGPGTMVSTLGAPAAGVVVLRGRAPARTPQQLADLLRSAGAGLPERVLREMGTTTGTWLQGERRSSPATQAGYIREVAWWITWVAARGLDPTDVSHVEADLYAAALRAQGLKDATRARRLSAVSSWYAYLHRAGLAARNPFGPGMDRPRVDQYSSTRGISADDMERMLACAKARESTRTYALLAVMFSTGCRVGSVTDTTVGSLGHDSGHRTIDLPVKGGKTKRFVLPPLASEAIDDYLEQRAEDTAGPGGPLPGDAPLFATRTGRHIDQPYVFRLVRRIAAAADVQGADQLSPHSIRHGVATLLLGSHALHVVQDFLGHANPNTTRRYDEDRESLDRSPAYALGQTLRAGVARRQSRFERPV
ncbi:tyrosine-type recombinase/integrase [Actinomadura xylanilytica]|uniref:tyrosine-type recombinase/integrase n=1 Tax=Actinomadura xylanilytica TaxID=887459 RepID=UPI00255B1836|nr:tyrosine-type recombinase/integrase [Actinomadura xylanilytica]MDL4776827.1 tyrosine-type recombinase/integrase [Actinomadura xylanilytica]